MFQVPGWSISATLKRQIAPSPTRPQSSAIDAKPQLISRKRKRKRGASPHDSRRRQNLRKQIDGKVTEEEEGIVSEQKAAADAAAAKSKNEVLGASEEHLKFYKSRGLFQSNRARKLKAAQGSTFIASPGGGERRINTKHHKMKRAGLPDAIGAGDGTQQPKTTLSLDHHSAELNSPPQTVMGSLLTPMQKAMREKLVAARFRHLNETLYTSTSAANLELFSQSPKLWQDYHDGFSQQVQSWPENPVDTFSEEVRRRAKALGRHARGVKSLPRTQGRCTIIDMGCGDAKFARAFQHDHKELKLWIRSFDLNTSETGVEKADCANLPLPDGSADIVLICLALMGTNWVDLIDEAFRVLHWKGELWVAEIKSRFVPGTQERSDTVVHSVGARIKRSNDRDVKLQNRIGTEEERMLSLDAGGGGKAGVETDVSQFIRVLEHRGFRLNGSHEDSIDLRNKMFARLMFVKAVTPRKGKHAKGDLMGNKRLKWLAEVGTAHDADDNLVLKPCVYKVR